MGKTALSLGETSTVNDKNVFTLFKISALKILRTYLVIILTAYCISNAFSQNVSNKSNESKSKNSINSSADQLIQSLSEGNTTEEVSAAYYNLSVELFGKGELEKAEIYINKAIKAEKEVKGSKKLSEYFRHLGKIQEALKKHDEASSSFEKASQFAGDNTTKVINYNDANRLKNKSSPETELKYLNQNALLIGEQNNNQDKIENLTQQANVNISLNNSDGAMENYNDALIAADSVQSLYVKSDMANLYTETKNYEKAIELQKEVVEQSQKVAGVETQVQQLRNLSNIYFASNSEEEGLSILLKAYQLSFDKGNFKEAKASLEQLADFYEKNKDNQKVVTLYKEFLGKLDDLISRDSSLFDWKMFQINEDKIAQLEKEQVLKDELIDRKNSYNYVLIGSVLLLIALVAIIFYAWQSIRKRNKKIALQSLRREMNPHFIYNSLNSVNQFIAQNNELEANKYLSSYSNLMRNIMENSNKDYVSLSNELEQLKKYLELEKMRFGDKFEYSIEISQDIDNDSVKVPNMIIQPHLENAIWHGLRYKETKGLLKLSFSKTGNTFTVLVDDNGIGLSESQSIKTKNQKLHESRGLKNVQERVRLLNEIYRTNIRFEITDKTGSEKGVIVKIEWQQ